MDDTQNPSSQLLFSPSMKVDFQGSCATSNSGMDVSAGNLGNNQSLLHLCRSMGRFFLIALCIMAICLGCGGPDHTNAAPNSGMSIDAQLSECNQGACDLKLPAGNFNFSIEVNPMTTIRIKGAGASYNNPGTPTPQYPSIERHCSTTLTWTGGNRAPFFFNSYHVEGSRLSGFCLNATGTSPPVFIDVDNSAGDIQLDDIIIDTPATKAEIAAIRYGNGGVVVGPKCTDVFVRAAAPIGFDLLNVQAHFMGLRCRAVSNDESEWTIGDSTHTTESFQCVFCTAEAAPGNTAIVIRNVLGFSWTNGYTEGAIAFDIPPDAVNAQQVTISNSFASGGGKVGVAAFVRSGLSTATVSVTGNEILGGPQSYIVEDDSLSRASVVGNTMPSAAAAKNGSKVCTFGNAATPAPRRPAVEFCN